MTQANIDAAKAVIGVLKAQIGHHKTRIKKGNQANALAIRALVAAGDDAVRQYVESIYISRQFSMTLKRELVGMVHKHYDCSTIACTGMDFKPWRK